MSGDWPEDWQDDPYLRDLARELRERLGDEFREDAEEAEALAARWFARSRTLADVATEFRDRGDTVAVETGSQVLTGRVTYVAPDYFSLDTAGAVVEVSLAGPVALHVVERARAGGTGNRPGPNTFRARLLELEMRAADVELASAVFADVRRCRIVATARDHVVVRGAGTEEWFVPVDTIRYVRVPGDTRG